MTLLRESWATPPSDSRRRETGLKRDAGAKGSAGDTGRVRGGGSRVHSERHMQRAAGGHAGPLCRGARAGGPAHAADTP